MTSSVAVPRLRLHRTPGNHAAQAGPSRLALLSDEEEQATPIAPRDSALDRDLNPPAAILRTLLHRFPNETLVHPAQPSSSLRDSDFDTSTPGPSRARDEIASIFYAMAGTPPRRRRGSIDSSDLEASPRVDAERAKLKSKRRSLSDEEGENPSKSQTSSSRRFDELRNQVGTAYRDNSRSGDGTFFRDISQEPQPVATSTPYRSMQLPSHYASNLMDQDSSMQRQMHNLDSFESETPSSVPPVPGVSVPNLMGNDSDMHRAMNGSESYVGTIRGTPAPPQHRLSHARSFSNGRSKYEPRDGASSRASSSHSSENKDVEREREMSWNRPKPKESPSTHRSGHLPHSPQSSSPHLARTSSPIPRGSLSRRGSDASSSFLSSSDYRERQEEEEKERNEKREHDWNKPVPRPSSSLSMHGDSRQRTLSQPSPARQVLQRHNSHTSSRPSSPSGSMHSSQGDIEEIVVRERNWNAPRPKWHDHPSHTSPPSVRERAESFTSRIPKSPSVRERAESLTARHTPENSRPTLRASASHSTLSPRHASPSLRPVSPQPSRLRLKTPSSLPRPASPQPRATPSPGTNFRSPNKKAGPSQLQHSVLREPSPSTTPIAHNPPEESSRVSWSFPRRTLLPTMDFGNETSPERNAVGRQTPSPSPSASSSGGSPGPTPWPVSPVATKTKPRTSGIPVRSPSKNEDSSSDTAPERKLGHRRSKTEFNEASGRNLPSMSFEVDPFAAEVQDRMDELALVSPNDPSGTPPAESTPIARVIDLTVDEVLLPKLSPLGPLRTGSSSNKIGSPVALEQESPPASPEKSPTRTRPEVTISTPVRKTSFTTTRQEFQTPSPPRGMPELPGPPSTSEEEDEDERTPIIRADITSLKTPRPPGAWMNTPMSEPTGGLAPLPAVQPDTVAGSSGLATPMASLSRGNTLPTRTPAPPGGWTNTPATEGRKSILKVRFSAPDLSVNEETTTADEFPSFQPQALNTRLRGTSDGTVDASSFLSGEEVGRTLPMTPRPLNGSTGVVVGVGVNRSARKSPGIRVLDAFGREQVSEDFVASSSVENLEEQGQNGEGETEQDDDEEPTPSFGTARSKSAVRLVDAMGREVEEGPSANTSLDAPLTHNEAIVRVRAGIAELATGLGDLQCPNDEVRGGDARLDELNEVSRAARDVRLKLAETLRMAKSEEANIRSKYRPLKEGFKSRLPSNPAVLWGLLALQLILCIFLYRLSIDRARTLFLTTYYDPFYPQLHLHPVRPDVYRQSMIPTPHSSILALPETIREHGWGVVGSFVRDYFALMVSDWQRYLWQTLGAADTQLRAWPPT